MGRESAWSRVRLAPPRQVSLATSIIECCFVLEIKWRTMRYAPLLCPDRTLSSIKRKLFHAITNWLDVTEYKPFRSPPHFIQLQLSELNIFNAEESGLFYKLLPNRSLVLKGDACHGGKNSKERITILPCANMTGTEKWPLLAIGKAAKPCFFQGDLIMVWPKNLWLKWLQWNMVRVKWFRWSLGVHCNESRLYW